MLNDKVVVVTGAGRGIGRDMAHAMARQGARVVVNDPGVNADGTGADGNVADQVVREIEAVGGRAIADTHSVSEWDSAHRIVRTAVDSFGRIDAVVNNAGILRDRMFHKMSLEEWRAVIDVHLNGSFYVARAAAPHFKEQGCGAYVHMTSTSGMIGNLGQANYAAAKLGIIALSKSIAMDMAKFGVTSNCISPFAWSRLIGTMPENTPEERAKVERIRTMESSKIAPMAVFLASDRARNVSGQIFAVRANEIFLMSQHRPIRSMHRADGWTPDSIADHAIPAMRPSFFALDRSADVFSWDPV